MHAARLLLDDELYKLEDIVADALEEEGEAGERGRGARAAAAAQVRLTCQCKPLSVNAIVLQNMIIKLRPAL